jgi:hypothetical protein
MKARICCLLALLASVGCDPAAEIGTASDDLSEGHDKIVPGLERHLALASPPPFNNAHWLARIAAAAYRDDAGACSELRPLGIDCQRDVKFLAQDDLRAIYVATPEVRVLAFRGSDNLNNWVFTNTNIGMGKYSPVGWVHNGAALAARRFWYEQIRWLVLSDYDPDTKEAPLYVVGHSLGGWLATFSLMQALYSGCLYPAAGCEMYPEVDVTALYTFGSPRPGDAAFAEDIARLAGWRNTRIYRFVNDDDVAAWLPNTGGYRHLGLPLPDPRFADERWSLVHLGAPGQFGYEKWLATDGKNGIAEHDKLEYRTKLAVLARDWKKYIALP